MRGRIQVITQLKSATRNSIDMTREERRIINGLLARDEKIHNVFRDKAVYEELVNDLYLMENAGRRLGFFRLG